MAWVTMQAPRALQILVNFRSFYYQSHQVLGVPSGQWHIPTSSCETSVRRSRWLLPTQLWILLVGLLLFRLISFVVVFAVVALNVKIGCYFAPFSCGHRCWEKNVMGWSVAWWRYSFWINDPENHHIYGKNHPQMVGLQYGIGLPTLV